MQVRCGTSDNRISLNLTSILRCDESKQSMNSLAQNTPKPVSADSALLYSATDVYIKTTRSPFMTLPLELLLCIGDSLRPFEKAALALTCKHLQQAFAHSWRRLISHKHLRLCFFKQLDKDLPEHRYCAGCQKFHARVGDAAEKQFITSARRSLCGELNVPLVEGMYLSWTTLQLKIRACHYESGQYGITTRYPTSLPDTFDAKENLTWHNTVEKWAPVYGRLMALVCSFRPWHGSARQFGLEAQETRGFRITVEHDLKGKKAILCVRRLIDVASLWYWENERYPGWHPSKEENRTLYWPAGRYDPTACLPGLNWEELPPDRQTTDFRTWTAWGWCSRTGAPYNVE